jgi:hypothetical protein
MVGSEEQKVRAKDWEEASLKLSGKTSAIVLEL